MKKMKKATPPPTPPATAMPPNKPPTTPPTIAPVLEPPLSVGATGSVGAMQRECTHNYLRVLNFAIFAIRIKNAKICILKHKLCIKAKVKVSKENRKIQDIKNRWKMYQISK